MIKNKIRKSKAELKEKFKIVIDSGNKMRVIWIDLLEIENPFKLAISDFEYYKINKKDNVITTKPGEFYIREQRNGQQTRINYWPVSSHVAKKFIEINKESTDKAVEAMNRHIGNLI
jgi:flagellar basal body rod protein FlgG